MTLSAPARLHAFRGFGPANFTRRDSAVRRTAPAGTAIPFRSTQLGHTQHILMVKFTSPDGRAWQAIGGGDSLADAIAFAQDSCPADAIWQPSSWSDLYGE